MPNQFVVDGSVLELLTFPFTASVSFPFQAFAKGQCLPNQLNPDLTGPPMSLSPHLRFGSLSVRHFYWAIQRTFMEVRGCCLVLSFSLIVCLSVTGYSQGLYGGNWLFSLSPHHRFRSLLSVTSTIQRAFMEVSSCLVLFLTFASGVWLSVSYWAVPGCAVELEIVLTVICVTDVQLSWK